MSVFAATPAIGTPDHPTIDGGMINIAGSRAFLVHAKNFQIVSTPQIAYPTFHDDAESHLPATPFNDHWMTDKRVGAILTRAAQRGQLAYVLQQTRELQVPASLALVPVIESSYQTDAVSNKGAVGAWQLMPSVANDYHLAPEDRFNFKLSTHTALQLLKHLHQQFGNWDLALAAYEAGSGRVALALQQDPNATTVNELYLPAVTKQYVEHMKAIQEVVVGETHVTA
jgi:hypothetical protein